MNDPIQYFVPFTPYLAPESAYIHPIMRLAGQTEYSGPFYHMVSSRASQVTRALHRPGYLHAWPLIRQAIEWVGGQDGENDHTRAMVYAGLLYCQLVSVPGNEKNTAYSRAIWEADARHFGIPIGVSSRVSWAMGVTAADWSPVDNDVVPLILHDAYNIRLAKSPEAFAADNATLAYEYGVDPDSPGFVGALAGIFRKMLSPARGARIDSNTDTRIYHTAWAAPYEAAAQSNMQAVLARWAQLEPNPDLLPTSTHDNV